MGVHLTRDQPDSQADQTSCWHAVVPLLTTRCLNWRWGCWGGQWEHRGYQGFTSEKWRWSIAKYSWKLKMLYWTVQAIEHELRSIGPKLVPLLAIRYLYLGHWEGKGGDGVHLTNNQPDPQTDQMSCWPAVVTLLITRCLYWGGSWHQGANRGHSGHQGVTSENEDSLLQSTLENSRQSIEHCRQ